MNSDSSDSSNSEANAVPPQPRRSPVFRILTWILVVLLVVLVFAVLLDQLTPRMGVLVNTIPNL
jgi:hypothetical protein